MSAMLTVNHHDLAQQTYVETGLMKTLVEGLRAALAWKVQGDDFSRKLSTTTFIAKSFRRHLERLMTLEETDGYMDMVLETKPNQGKLVDSLRQEHERFRRATRKIVHQFERVSATDHETFNSICDKLSAVLQDFDSHCQKEAKLFQVAFEQEEGGEG